MNQQKLLNRMAEIYSKAITTEILESLEIDPGIAPIFYLGVVTDKLSGLAKGKDKEWLIETGFLNADGTEKYLNHLFIPLWSHKGHMQSFILLCPKSGEIAFALQKDGGFAPKLATGNCQEIKSPIKALRSFDVENPTRLNPFSKSKQKEKPKDEDSYSPTDEGFECVIDRHKYSVHSLCKRANQPEGVLVINDRPVYVKFYRPKDQKEALERMAVGMGISVEEAEKDYSIITQHLETWFKHKELENEIVTVDLTDEDRKQATTFLKQADLVQQIICDFESYGLVGEEVNKLLAYFVCLSSKMDDPLSLFVKAPSATGKSHLVKTVLEFVPDPYRVDVSRLTKQSMFYRQSLKHKILSIEEAQGAIDAVYAIRVAGSNQKLTLSTAGNDTKTREHTVEGPFSILVTSTKTFGDEETMSRFVVIAVDESEAQTERILEFQRRYQTLEKLEIDKTRVELKARYHNLFHVLDNNIKVVNPFAPTLEFPATSLQARREQPKYLQLIKAICFLHQLQRQVKESVDGNRYIEVTQADIDLANQLAPSFLFRATDDLTDSEKLVLQFFEQCPDQTFTRSQIQDYLTLSEPVVRRGVNKLEAMGRLITTGGNRAKGYEYQLRQVRLNFQANSTVEPVQG